jgi:hypothetical protein
MARQTITAAQHDFHSVWVKPGGSAYLRKLVRFAGRTVPFLDEEKGSLAGERLPFDALSDQSWLEDH